MLTYKIHTCTHPEDYRFEMSRFLGQWRIETGGDEFDYLLKDLQILPPQTNKEDLLAEVEWMYKEHDCHEDLYPLLISNTYSCREYPLQIRKHSIKHDEWHIREGIYFKKNYDRMSREAREVCDQIFRNTAFATLKEAKTAVEDFAEAYPLEDKS